MCEVHADTENGAALANVSCWLILGSDFDFSAQLLELGLSLIRSKRRFGTDVQESHMAKSPSPSVTEDIKHSLFGRSCDAASMSLCAPVNDVNDGHIGELESGDLTVEIEVLETVNVTQPFGA